MAYNHVQPPTVCGIIMLVMPTGRQLRPMAMLALALISGWHTTASAQPYPSKPIHIVVPFAPGGITDVIGRALGQRLAEALGQQVVIENKPGGGTGQVGTDYVARSAPDGYTLLVTADATFVTAPHTYSKLPYDANSDFVPITALGISPQALVVHPSLPVRTLADLVELAKKKPGEINYGTFGIGSSGHLNIILLEGMTGTKFTPVHYRGAAPAITDLIGGHIQMMIVSIGLVRQSWQAGGLKVLGFGSPERIAQYPDVPTLAESGLPGYEAGSWYALAAPKGTPRDIVMKLNAETQHIFNDPAFQQKFLAPNFIFPLVSSPDAFAERIRTESAKWGKVIKDANVKVE
jgi:tripartite-type tricarboxylate transporter receptor subunit TctC